MRQAHFKYFWKVLPSREAWLITQIVEFFFFCCLLGCFFYHCCFTKNRESLDDIHAKRARLTEAKKRGELDMDKIDEINQSMSKKSAAGSRSGRHVHEEEEEEEGHSRRRRSDPGRSSRPSGRSRHRDDDYADHTR